MAEYLERPVLGWGFGRKFLAEETFRMGWNTGLADNWVSTHNYLISFLYMTGIPGLISFLLIISYYFTRNLQFLKHQEDEKYKMQVRAFLGCAFYILVLGLFEVVLEIPYQGVFLWVFLALGMAIISKAGSSSPSHENTINT
jgi:O-antigen ligase